jgi:CRISPR-associated endonuclease Csn1
LYKTRDDHRHHALDAIVLGLIDTGTVAQLQRQAQIASARGLRLTSVDQFPLPWNGFTQQVQQRLDEINVSFRADHRLGGALHAATNYSDPIPSAGGKTTERHLRTRLHLLTEKDITGDSIVDPVVRRIVQEKFVELGSGDPEKLFVEPANHPCMISKDGRRIPIHKVRLRVSAKPKTIGRGTTQRHVASGPNSNHHVVIAALLDSKGRETKWEEHVASRLEANSRLSVEAKNRGETIINRQWGNDRRFKFSMMANDVISMLDENGVRQLFRVANISAGDHEFRLHKDARDSTEIRKSGTRIRMTPEKLRKAQAFKVAISPLGDWTQVRE